MSKSLILFATSIFSSILCFSQNAEYYSITEEIPEIVISATKTEKKAQDLALPAILLYGKQITLSGYSQLNDLLAEQSGITISEDHGAGIQVQGFDPEYSMILIDGSPILGKVTGSIDLRRINLRNIERIEIIKGGGSCLYGSEAMGAVVNIITKSPSKERYGDFFTTVNSSPKFDIGSSWQGKNKGIGWSVFANYQRQMPVDINQDVEGISIGAFSSLDLQAKAYYSAGNYDFKSTLRNNVTTRPGNSFEGIANTAYYLESHNRETALTQEIERQHNKGLITNLKVYASLFNSSEIEAQSFENISDTGNVRHGLINPEFQIKYPKSSKTMLIFGLGSRIEGISASRYSSTPTQSISYSYAQWQFRPIDQLEITSGLRFDHNPLFGSRFSPKWTVFYKTKQVNYRGSFAYGFKAPDFRQQYINYTNQAVGYTVIGAALLRERLNQLEEQGLTRARYLNDEDIAPLRAENSKSLNIGANIRLTKGLNIDINLFHNWMHQLINTIPVALKQNGQYWYSYINQNNIITRGVEFNAKYNNQKSNLQLNFGLNYLEAFQQDVIAQLEEGKHFAKDENQRTVRLTKANYLGLFGRSPLSLNASIKKELKKLNTTLYLRWNWRNPFPFSDTNANQIADSYDQLYPSYHMLNFSAMYNRKRWSVLMGANNLINYKSMAFLPNNPGRIYNLTFHYKITQND